MQARYAKCGARAIRKQHWAFSFSVFTWGSLGKSTPPSPVLLAELTSLHAALPPGSAHPLSRLSSGFSKFLSAPRVCFVWDTATALLRDNSGGAQREVSVGSLNSFL